jgi:tRNA(fMet)-specific endonuclease VapC
MAGSFLLDTNIVIALFASEDAVSKHAAVSTDIYVPAVVLGELYYGAHKSSRPDTNVQRVTDFASASAVLTCDATTAWHYGGIKDALRRKGRPIPENDIWIAAVASQHGLTVVSRDEHFALVDGLVIVDWRVAP